MTCTEIHAALEREALGLVGPEETALLGQHLPRCADCAGRARAVRQRYQDLVGGVAAEADALGPLLISVGDRLQAALTVDRPRQHPRKTARLALALAGAAVVFLASALLDGRSRADAVAFQQSRESLPSTRLRGLP